MYDGKGRLRKRTDWAWTGSSWYPNGEVRYVYDGMRVIQERTSANHPAVTYTRGLDLSGTWEGAGGIGGLLARSAHSSTSPYQPSTHACYHADGNGNVTYLLRQDRTHGASYKYDPYGKLLASSGPLASANTLRFSSKQWHEHASLYHYGYRFYVPELQRWLNRDPSMEEGGFNLYGFVHNDPLNLVDDTGERPIRPGPGNPGGRNPYRYPNGRPIYTPPRPPRQNPPNPWPSGRQASMCISILVAGPSMQRAARKAEDLAQQLLGDPAADPCPPPPPSPCPPKGRSLPPYVPNFGSYVNAPPDLGLYNPAPPPRSIPLPRDSWPVFVAPGITIIRY